MGAVKSQYLKYLCFRKWRDKCLTTGSRREEGES